jgi:twitching motility protein PilT
MAINMRKLLEGMARVNASDMHLKVGTPPILRLAGQLLPVEHPPLVPEDTDEANNFMMPARCKEQLDREGTVDYSFGLSTLARFRVNCFHQRGAKSLAIRKLDTKKLSLDDLKLPAQLGKLAEFHRGLVLVTGVTGSGKSSTLSAIINMINDSRRAHIITVEDPIEFVYVDNLSIINQIEVGQDVVSFSCALRHALRQDPDILLIGELRDRETIETAMHMVDTGHLVFSTLHTPDAPQTVTRISHHFNVDEQELIYEQMSKNLQAVICQRLVRTADGRGRVPCCEIMFQTPMTTKLILERRITDLPQVLRSGVDGMQSFDRHLVDLVKAKTITPEEALTVVEDPAAFNRLLKGKSSGGDMGSLFG